MESGQFTPITGEQIKNRAFNVETPSTEDAMERYLASGLIKGIGPSTARNN